MFSNTGSKNGRGGCYSRYKNSHYTGQQHQPAMSIPPRPCREYQPFYENNTQTMPFNFNNQQNYSHQNREWQQSHFLPDTRAPNPRNFQKKYNDKKHLRERNHIRSPESNSSSGSARKHPSQKDSADNIYICSGCYSPYDFSSRFGQISGKVPLILGCHHTVCQECIYKGAMTNNIICPNCKKRSELSNKSLIDCLHEAFSPNYYVIGVIAFAKGLANNSKGLTLVPAEEISHARNSSTIPLSMINEGVDCADSCCFGNCDKPAELQCHDCSDVYCLECSNVVHKSAKSMRAHKPRPITRKKISRDLEMCTEHNMSIEFFCTECDVGACCYCFINQHTGHAKEDLSKLSDEDFLELEKDKLKLKHIYKMLLLSQKKLRECCNSNKSTVGKMIADYFKNLHGMIQCIEKDLLNEAHNIHEKTVASENLNGLLSNIKQSLLKLTAIMVDCEQLRERKLNVRKLMMDIQEALNTPCFILDGNEKNIASIQFSVDPVLDNIKDYFEIKTKDGSDLRLVTCNEIPSGYIIEDNIDNIDDNELKMSLGGLHPPNERKAVKKQRHHSGPKIVKIPKLDDELVEVTHIESLENFYVQIKKSQFHLRQLNTDIGNYIEMADMVKEPDINELYLALYITNDKKIWRRGRLTAIKTDEKETLYEIFFIDYGNTQAVDISKLREISNALALPKPFALHCELYNPGCTSWKKNAHVYMGKMINNKDVYMMPKGKHGNVRVVDLLVSSSDKSLTSLVDILINTCSNSVKGGESSSDSSVMQMGFTRELKIFTNSKTFEKDQEEKVLIVKVIDPHHIYIHLANNLEAMQNLFKDVKHYYKNSRCNTCVLLEGTYVIVEYKDPIRGNWHRALIKRVEIASETAIVFLVDWGFQVTVPWTKVKTLKENLTRMEAQAILVRLAHIEPIDKIHGWSESATNFLQKYIQSRETLRLIVNDVDPLEVGLFEIVSDVDVCVNAMLVNAKYANSTGQISAQMEWPRYLPEGKTIEKDDSLLGNLLAKVEFGDSDESSDNETTVIRQPITIVKVFNPGLIYIKFNCKKAVALQLHKELQDKYLDEKESKESWEEGDYCVVFFNNYYTRGKVIGREDENKYKIHLYDEVSEIVLHASKIFIYMKYFQKYPSMVYKAHLANIKPAGGDKWSLYSSEALTKIFESYSDIYATKVPGDTSDKSIPMKMWYACVLPGSALEVDRIKYLCINTKLVKLGLAYKIEEKTNEPEMNSSPMDTSNITEGSPEGNAEKDKEEKTDSETTDWNALVDEEEKRLKNAATEKEITDWLPPIVPEKREFYAWILCDEIEGILFYRPECLQEVYQVMEGVIRDHFTDSSWENKHPNHVWKVDDLCMIKFSGLFYRGKVLKVQDQEHISVVMIDFGSDHEVTSKDLIKEILYPNVAPFAARVKMAGIYAKSGKWWSSDYETMHSIIKEYARIKIIGPLNVDLPKAEVYTETGESFNDMLVELCSNLTRHLEPTKGSDDDASVIIEEEVDAIQSPDDDDDDHDQKEEKEDQIKTQNLTLKFEPLPELDTFQMLVVSVVSHNQVILKLKDNVDDTSSKSYKKLQLQIQESHADQPALDNVQVGEACIAPYHMEEHLEWHRACVHNIDGLDFGYVFIFYVDIGVVDSVAIDDLKVMKMDWFELPVNCYVATLGVDLSLEIHKEHVCQLMKKMQGKKKYVKIISRGEPLVVNLLDEGGDLSYQSLIRSGMLTECLE